ncbi:lysophospholipid acyltransferase [Cladochytrium tenue]|nr:lysophospholipid acyltransferase [Cladochytrium tenue]
MLPAVDAAVAAAAAHLRGAPPDTVKGACILVASFLFGFLFLLIPTTRAYAPARHAFSVIVSCVVFFAFFDLAGFLELMAMATIFYAATRTRRSDRRVAIALCVYAMVHLTTKYVFTQILVRSDVKFDHIIAMMMLVIKLTSFAWSAYDGTRPEAELWPDHASSAIREFPGLLEFFGYVFFFPTFFIGPAIEFREYQLFIHNEPPFDATPKSRALPVLRPLLLAAAFAAILVTLGPHHNYFLCADPAFARLPLLHRTWRLVVAGMVTRTKYYSAWKLAAAACNLCGFGYSGNGRWDRGENVNVWGYEFGHNPRATIASWNLKTGVWLRKCIYLRVVPKGGKPGGAAALTTFFASAAWHGLRPGYYLTFLAGAVITQAGRVLHRRIRPLFHAPRSPLRPYLAGLPYTLVSTALTVVAIDIAAAPFMLWKLQPSLAVWKAFYYAPITPCLAVVALLEWKPVGMALDRLARSWGHEGERRRGKPTADEDVDLRAAATGNAASATNGPSESKKRS